MSETMGPREPGPSLHNSLNVFICRNKVDRRGKEQIEEVRWRPKGQVFI